MEDFNIILHKLHVTSFFDNFYERVKNINEANEILSYIEFQILIEEQRLSRYHTQLKPNLYLDHKLYVDEISSIIQKLIGIKASALAVIDQRKNQTFTSNIHGEKIRLLFEQLKGIYISEETEYSSFESLLRGNELTSQKIIWLKRGRNRELNKKSITDLVDILLSKSIIQFDGNLNDKLHLLNNYFRYAEGDIKFTNSNFTKPRNHSEFRTDLERIIESIL